MTSSLDSNTWYNIRYGTSTATSAMLVQDINSSGSGAVIQYALNYTGPTYYQWQALPIGSTNTYILRNKYLGNQWSMGIFWQPLSTLPGMDTRVATFNYKTPNDVPKTAQWIIEPTNDGTGMYYLSAVSNGTGVHLDNLQTILYLRDASTAGTNAMKWSFSSVSAINDGQWSYTSTATSRSATSVTSSSVPSSSTGPASNPATTTSSTLSQQTTSASSSSSLSGGVVAGAVIGGVAVLLIIFGAIWFWRKKKRTSEYVGPNSSELESHQQSHPPLYSHMSMPVKAQPGIYEKPLNQHYQPPQQSQQPTINRPWETSAELPADPVTYNTYNSNH